MAGVKVLGATQKVMDALDKASSYMQKDSEAVQDIHPTPDDGSYTNFSSTSFVPVRVVQGNGVTGYICDIFEKGLSEPPTKQGRVFLANGNSTIYVLPAGTVMYAQAVEVQKMGSNN